MPDRRHDLDLVALVTGMQEQDVDRIVRATDMMAPDVDEVTRSFALLVLAAREVKRHPNYRPAWRNVRLAVEDVLDALDKFMPVPNNIKR